MKVMNIMTNEEYIKRRDEILPDYDDDNACICYKDCAHPKDKTAAQQAIDALVLAVIGDRYNKLSKVNYEALADAIYSEFYYFDKGISNAMEYLDDEEDKELKEAIINHIKTAIEQ